MNHRNLWIAGVALLMCELSACAGDRSKIALCAKGGDLHRDRISIDLNTARVETMDTLRFVDMRAGELGRGFAGPLFPFWVPSDLFLSQNGEAIRKSATNVDFYGTKFTIASDKGGEHLFRITSNGDAAQPSSDVLYSKSEGILDIRVTIPRPNIGPDAIFLKCRPF